MMKKIISLIILIFYCGILLGQNPKPKVTLGIEILMRDGLAKLKGKKVGLITNATGVNSRMQSTIDLLSKRKDFQLVALFGPEHGVRGNFSAGEKIESYIDEETGIPVHSLYGKNRKPTKEMLKGIDVLIYDIQDIGVRSYTYISTMGLAMEAAAENNISFVVLDRPNPLTGEKFEGSIVREGFFSFIGQFPIPYIYGLTCGELAFLLNEEGMLANGLKCDLTVIKMEGWKRNMMFEETGLNWVLTSPHIPHSYSPLYYAASGILGELQVISEGVGYTLPFQLFGAEWIDGFKLSKNLNSLNLPGVLFRPISFKPYYGIHKDKNLNGIQFFITDLKKCNLTSIQFYVLQELKKLYPEKNIFDLAKPERISSFDKATGWDKIRILFSKYFKYDDIRIYWEKEADEFKSKAKKYFLY